MIASRPFSSKFVFQIVAWTVDSGHPTVSNRERREEETDRHSRRRLTHRFSLPMTHKSKSRLRHRAAACHQPSWVVNPTQWSYVVLDLAERHCLLWLQISTGRWFISLSSAQFRGFTRILGLLSVCIVMIVSHTGVGELCARHTVHK